MLEELSSIKKNKTLELVGLSTDEKAIGVKWVYKLKTNHEGKIVKYKTRLVA